MTPKCRNQKYIYTFFNPSHTRFPTPNYFFHSFTPNFFPFPHKTSLNFFFPLTSFISHTKFSFLTQNPLLLSLSLSLSLAHTALSHTHTQRCQSLTHTPAKQSPTQCDNASNKAHDLTSISVLPPHARL